MSWTRCYRRLWLQLTKNKFEELDPVLQKLTHHARWTPEEVIHAQDDGGFCARMLAALQGERSKFTRGMLSCHDFDMFSISERGVLVKAETSEVRWPDPMAVCPNSCDRLQLHRCMSWWWHICTMSTPIRRYGSDLGGKACLLMLRRL